MFTFPFLMIFLKHFFNKHCMKIREFIQKNNRLHVRSFVHCTLTFIAWLTLYNTWNFTFYSVGCTRNEDCHLTEACINNACQHPCAIHNPCAPNAVCINTNHGSDCSCAEGYQGNGYVGCVPGNKSFIIHSSSKWPKWLIICNKCPVFSNGFTFSMPI